MSSTLAAELVTTDAVLLSRLPYRDADLIVTLFTERAGKVSALARSARRSRKRFAGALGLLSVLEVEVKRDAKRDLATLSQAVLKEDFSQLSHDMVAFAHANYATELTRELSVENQPDRPVFRTLVEYYRELRSGGADVSMLRGFELSILDALGLSPVLAGCAACGGEELPENAIFDPSQGGVLCEWCAPAVRAPGVRMLGAEARDHLSELQCMATLTACRDVTAPAEVRVECRKAMLSLISHHVEKPLRSLEFVRKLTL